MRQLLEIYEPSTVLDSHLVDYSIVFTSDWILSFKIVGQISLNYSHKLYVLVNKYVFISLKLKQHDSFKMKREQRGGVNQNLFYKYMEFQITNNQ